MALIQLEEKKNIPPILSLGFRPFFLSAGVFSIVIMLAWLIFYRQDLHPAIDGLPVIQWHAHEMLYGYAMAVIAGFLLTAVRNWTGIQTLEGYPLLVLWLLWLVARLAINLHAGLYPAMLADLAFNLMLVVAIFRPIVSSRNWQQTAIVFKLLLLTMGNAFFYAGLTGYLEQGIHWGIYTGLFLVLGLVLTLGRRVIPFFIERGVGYDVQLRNSKWLDGASLVLLLLLYILVTFTDLPVLAAIVSLLLFVVHSIRLVFWHTRGIWKNHLLWSLYLGYGFIVLGFGMYAMAPLAGQLYFPAIHSLAVGGIGLLTLSMMSRVSLGHTGRNVQQPPRLVVVALLLLLLAALVRVFLPLLLPGGYADWMLLAQAFWIGGFVCFVLAYSGILVKPDVV